MMTLYRAHSRKYLLTQPVGVFENPNLIRSRRPRDITLSLHSIIDDWFEHAFGMRYRSKSVFCTGDCTVAAGYVSDRAALIELSPLEDFSICFSPQVKDLFGHFQFASSSLIESPENVQRELTDLGYVEYKNSGLELAASTGHEVMVYATRFKYNLL